MNVDPRTVEGFGQEWSVFDQASLSEAELSALFSQYFAVFPDGVLQEDAVGFDLGCGSGRWARFIAPEVAKLYCIDASEKALDVARKNLARFENCEFHLASVESIPLEAGSMDFGYSLGVLHHVPDTQAGIDACARPLRPGAPLLLYLYYNLENRGRAFRALWKISDLLRRLISRAPFPIRRMIASVIAATVYLPLARISTILPKRYTDRGALPLSFYRDRSFYTMRTDALDRFGTRLEKRFSKAEIEQMMGIAGLERVRFSDAPPYWCVVGFKRADSRPGR